MGLCVSRSSPSCKETGTATGVHGQLATSQRSGRHGASDCHPMLPHQTLAMASPGRFRLLAANQVPQGSLALESRRTIWGLAALGLAVANHGPGGSSSSKSPTPSTSRPVMGLLRRGPLFRVRLSFVVWLFSSLLFVPSPLHLVWAILCVGCSAVVSLPFSFVASDLCCCAGQTFSSSFLFSTTRELP